MKRLFTILLIIGALSGVGATAQAATPQLCVFTDTGVITCAGGLNAEILISGDEMVIASGEADEQRVAISKVAAIAYSDETDKVTGIVDENVYHTEMVTAYGADGVKRGEFASAAEAVTALPAGVYVIKSDSFTLKIRIK